MVTLWKNIVKRVVYNFDNHGFDLQLCFQSVRNNVQICCDFIKFHRKIFEDPHGSRLYGAAGPEFPEHPFPGTRRQKWISFFMKLTL